MSRVPGRSRHRVMFETHMSVPVLTITADKAVPERVYISKS